MHKSIPYGLGVIYAIESNPAEGFGLTIGSRSGRITGTPTKAGTFTLAVKVTDKAEKTATESFSMAVSLIGDFNGDGVVNLSDYSLFVAAYGFSGGEDCWLQFRAFFVSLLSSDTEGLPGYIG